jgi:hypothetical protein
VAVTEPLNVVAPADVIRSICPAAPVPILKSFPAEPM